MDDRPSRPAGRIRRLGQRPGRTTRSRPAGLGSLWIADEEWSTVIRVDAGTGHVLARIPVTAGGPDSAPFFPVAGESAVWVVDYDGADSFPRIDPGTNQAVRVRESGGDGCAAAAGPAPG